ncbi:thioesterase II family protein [Microbispora triticiradicis]|uniref:thioesterase II family protein n=1 Tax=Microbispora triticiradicis TaxID=2200763 RepID=UPI001AD7D178|nr:alpha/beta fold hydrolase [Microbispora triticiradicis]MBO4274845.1 alpha/beta fold hydrolase [Microbispora triticiradicis]
MTETLLDDVWIRRYHDGPGTHGPAGPATLVCFPHAGGSASYFSTLSGLLRSSNRVLALQYPGRQDRLRERCLSTIDELADEAFNALEPLMGGPVALFGHSMGAMIAFEVATRMKRRRGLDPAALFVSGRRAPSRDRADDEIVHLGGDSALVAEMKRLSGTDARVLDDPEVVEMILPALRSDYRAVETYRYRPGPRLGCPTIALTGDDDPKAGPDEVDAWRDHTSGEFRMHVFPGGHFYLKEHWTAVADVIAGQLGRARPDRPR